MKQSHFQRRSLVPFLLQRPPREEQLCRWYPALWVPSFTSQLSSLGVKWEVKVMVQILTGCLYLPASSPIAPRVFGAYRWSAARAGAALLKQAGFLSLRTLPGSCSLSKGGVRHSDRLKIVKALDYFYACFISYFYNTWFFCQLRSVFHRTGILHVLLCTVKHLPGIRSGFLSSWGTNSHRTLCNCPGSSSI